MKLTFLLTLSAGCAAVSAVSNLRHAALTTKSEKNKKASDGEAYYCPVWVNEPQQNYPAQYKNNHCACANWFECKSSDDCEYVADASYTTPDGKHHGYCIDKKQPSLPTTSPPTKSPPSTSPPTTSPPTTSPPTTAPPSTSPPTTSPPSTAPPTTAPPTTAPPTPPQTITQNPVVAPTVAATEAPVAVPTVAATEAPVAVPTVAATEAPAVAPTVAATEAPVIAPTVAATEAPVGHLRPPGSAPTTTPPTEFPGQEPAGINIPSGEPGQNVPGMPGGGEISGGGSSMSSCSSTSKTFPGCCSAATTDPSNADPSNPSHSAPAAAEAAAAKKQCAQWKSQYTAALKKCKKSTAADLLCTACPLPSEPRGNGGAVSNCSKPETMLKCPSHETNPNENSDPNNPSHSAPAAAEAAAAKAQCADWKKAYAKALKSKDVQCASLPSKPRGNSGQELTCS